MKKELQRALMFFFLGLLFGIGIVLPFLFQAKADLTASPLLGITWQMQWERTREEWLKDRCTWRDGKPFEYNYGPRAERW